MNTGARRVLASRFMLIWVPLALIGSYFLFSFDSKKIREQGWSFRTVMQSISMPRIKLGIDLQGGTYLVLGVEVEKAVENRLVIESKSLDQLFDTKGLKTRPSKKEIKNLAVVLSFDNEESAKIAYNFMRREVPTLKSTLKENEVHSFLTPVEEQRIRTGSVEQGVSVLNNRLNSFGVSGLIVQRHGERQIVVQLPGVDDPERVRSIITKTAHLEFKIVEKTASKKEDLLDDFDYELPPDKMIISSSAKRGQDEEGGTWYLVSTLPDLTGDHIVDSRMTYDDFGRIKVSFQLDTTGAREFKELTGNNIGRQLGIVIDNVMYSAPRVQGAIGARGEISGINSIEEAQDLALVLRSGSLLAPLKFEQESRVGASLGQDSVRRGALSCLVGLLLLFIFAILYYRLPGFFAMLGLFYNLFLILLFLSYFEATLTLPGIAGMVLTIGMAVDASILIYERIREELVGGSTIHKAINDGFGGATVIILDSNITTFLTALVLFKFGGPAIKGFAVTLMAGIIATILSGIFFLRSLFEFSFTVTKGKLIKFRS